MARPVPRRGAPVVLPPSRLLADELYGATHQPLVRMDNPTGNLADVRRKAERIRSDLTRARKYVVDDDVAAAASVLGVQHPEVVLSMLSRARLAFPAMWIEWDQRAVMRAAGQDPATDAPARTGVLVEQMHAEGEVPLYRMSEVGFDRTCDPPVAVCNATGVLYSTEQPIAQRDLSFHVQRSEIARVSGLTKETLDVTLLGSTYSAAAEERTRQLSEADLELMDEGMREKVELRLERCRQLMSHAAHVWSPYWPSYDAIAGSRDPQVVQAVVRNSVLEFSGSWRFIVTVLALIQARDYTSAEQAPPNPARRRFVGNKVVPYLQHFRVSLKLPRQVVLRRMVRQQRSSLPLPRMEIEGHWKNRHGRGDPSCDHVFTQARRTVYRCALCSWERWWQPSFLKGSAEIGFVTKDRVVIRRNAQGRRATERNPSTADFDCH